MKLFKHKKEHRHQLTLFIEDYQQTIESFRADYNPRQHALIAAHITLCREDELEQLDTVLGNLRKIEWQQPLSVMLGPIERFADGKGLMLPGHGSNEAFHQLRARVLQGIIDEPRNHQPHLTLIHPRNGTCTDAVFAIAGKQNWPTQLKFTNVFLINQHQGDPWLFKERFSLLT